MAFSIVTDSVVDGIFTRRHGFNLQSMTPGLLGGLDPAVASLLSDLPFIALGSLGFAMIALMYMTNSMTRTSTLLAVAAITAFLASVLDVVKVIVVEKAAPIGVVLPLVLSREIFLSISVTAKFFYIWRLAGESVAVALVDGNPYTTSWSRWGLAGVFLNLALLLTTATIGITQAIWRLGFVFLMNEYLVPYDIDNILEIVASGVLALKLLANVWISPPLSPLKAFVYTSPLIFATLMGITGPIGDLITFDFSETPYGRILEAVQLYIYMIFLLFTSLYASNSTRGSARIEDVRSETVVSPSVPRGRSNSYQTVDSFHALSTPGSVDPMLGLQSPTPLLETSSYLPSASYSYRRPETARMSTAERLSLWVSERVVGRPEENWRSSLEQFDVERGQRKRRPSQEKVMQRPTRGKSSLLRASKADMLTTSFSEKIADEEAAQPVDEVMVFPAKSALTTSPTIETTRVISPTAVGRRSNSTDMKAIIVEPLPFLSPAISSPERTVPPLLRKDSSPIGLDGVVRRLEKSKPLSPSTAASDLDMLMREQDERDKTVAKLLDSRGSSLSKSLSAQSQKSVSMTSDNFSLSNFPSPPLSSLPSPPSAMRNIMKATSSVPKALSKGAKGKEKAVEQSGDDVVVDDVVFKLTPPNWTTGGTARTESYASFRTSAVGERVDYKNSGAEQWDITSFFDGTSSPVAASMTSGRNGSVDITVKNTSVDIHRRPSLEIITSPALPSSKYGAFDLSENEETPRIMEVKRMRPVVLSRLVEQNELASPDKESPVSGRPNPPNRVSSVAVLETPISALAPAFEISSNPQSGKGRAPVVQGPGRISPFPTRPIAGIGSLSTQMAGGTSPSSTRGQLDQRMFQRPRPAPLATPVSRNGSVDSRMPVSGRGGSPAGFI